ncbi:MAG: D-2-hydroxyacid dehydrogenase [Flavobacteriales bacterium]
MTKILANDGIDASGKVALEKAGFTVITDKVEQANLAKAINDNGYQVILVRSATQIRKDVMDQCPGIKMIGRGGVGMDNIDVEYGRSKGIDVFNTPGASSQSVAELVMAHMFGMARFLADSNRNMPSKGITEFNALKKKYTKGTELRGKTLGIVGFGRIGQSLASYALGCGMKVIAADSFIPEAEVQIHIEGAPTVSIKIKTISNDEIFKNADFISLHVPKQAGGKAVIGAEEIKKLKKGVCLVNTARGGVIEEKSLIAALNEGIVAYAALDVFDNEPTPLQEILSHPNISLTPHTGASTNEAQDRIGIEIAERIISFYQKQPA